MPDTEVYPWDIEAQRLVEKHGLPLETVRNAIIENWLMQGRTQPFYDWVTRVGHLPSQRVSLALAYMMMKSDSAGLNPNIEAEFPYGLKIDASRAGRPEDPEARIRNQEIARNVTSLIASGMKHEAAITAVHEWLGKIGASVSFETVRKAYEKHRSRMLR